VIKGVASSMQYNSEIKLENEEELGHKTIFFFLELNLIYV
jgi:hypothetical protein